MPSKRKSKGDVCWFSSKYKKPITYSTIADSDAISLINQPNMTANELKKVFESGKYLISQDMKKVIQAYIDKGLGEELIVTREI